MIGLDGLFEFSRTYCVAICAVLVPANLIATSQTLLMAWFRRSPFFVWIMAIAASFFAVLLMLHVMTWFVIGVVRIPTYVLLVLGTVCLSANIAAVAIATHSFMSSQKQLKPVR
jgi:hypothetical protein